jgi:hypothetical protein
MRAFIIVCITVCTSITQTGTALALGNSDQGPGCGLGKLAWSDYGGQKQIAPQVFMATTNGSFGSQTFGISFGTSGCTNDGVIMKNKRINFAAMTFENLKQEMAQGHGEHLSSLANLLGVAPMDQPLFFSMVQDRYTEIVPPGEATPLMVLHAIEEAMGKHPIWAKVVQPDMTLH